MSDKPDSWPLLPSHSSYTAHGLCAAFADMVQEAAGGTVSHRTLMKLNALAKAAELFTGEVAHFFGSRMGDDHDQLEALQDSYLDKDGDSR